MPINKDGLEFKRGYYCAVANILHLHGAPVIAEDVLRNYGHVDFRGISAQDRKTLQQVAKEISRKESRIAS